MGTIPNLTIMAPSDEIELRNMVKTCADYDDGPTVLRYPRGTGYGAETLQKVFGYELENGEIPTKGKLSICELGTVLEFWNSLVANLKYLSVSRRTYSYRKGANHSSTRWFRCEWRS
jgi:1-deoxy-D-xylulose-5-phosphate synthase